MTLPLWNAVESVANAIDELRKQTCDLAEKVAKDVVQLEQKVEALTVEVEQLKRGQFGSEPDPDTDSIYHWEVRDMEDQFQAGGQAGTLHEAMWNARGYAYQYAPCKVRVWTEKTIHEATFDD